MKTITKTFLTIGAVAGFSFTTAQAATITWDDGAGDDLWSSGANWDAPEVAPVNGDSVVLTNTAQSRLDYAWTIESGQSLTGTSGFSDELVLEGGGSAGTLTLATGGTMDIGFMRPRFSSGGQFIIEAGASLTTDNYGLSSVSATITYIADASGITLWDSSAGQFQSGGDNLVLDLTNYDFSNGDSFTLVDYGTFTLGGQEFASVTIIGQALKSIDYGSGTNDSIILTVPEPSSTALLGLGGLALMLRRKRS
jgi:hypothetical protein